MSKVQESGPLECFQQNGNEAFKSTDFWTQQSELSITNEVDK